MDPAIHPNAEPIPGYRLIERIGRGGYGEVWKAEAPGGMHKAIKFVSGDTDAFGDDGKAAEQEFKSLNRVKSIRHPFLLSIERFEVIDRQLVIVMELADRNLWDRFNECLRHGLPGIPRPELLRYLEEAAEALDLMNLNHQIQHLDIKPQNIFLVHQHVKVADFGLAKDLDGAKTNLTGGITPTYAPPETFEGWVSRQSDQYSLAIVYMEMLTGRRPFAGTNTRQLILQHLTAIPDLAPLSPADRPAVGRALSKVPDERFPTCADLIRALRGEVPAVALRSPPQAQPRVDRKKDPNDTDVPGGPTQLAPRTERRSIPALVTPGSRASTSGTVSQLRRAAAAVTPVTRGQPPVAERTADGVLFPALIVGVGGIGLSVLRALRQLVANRHGRPTLPHLRWLFIDSDLAAGDAAVTGPSTTALAPEDILLTRLRRPSHYLTREGLPAVDSWLPQEELFRMPKTPATEGVRGLGRLALCDHYHVVCHRLRTALEGFLTPAAVEEAERLTRLGIRSTFPRVYLATSLTGGTGSGMFLDLAYLIRRVSRQLGFGTPHVVGLLGVPTFCPGTKDGPAHANVRAALTELHHFACAGAGYRAQFDTREGSFDDSERPFRRCVLVPLGGRFDPAGPLRAAEVAAHAIAIDLLTPVGRTAHPDGPGEPNESPMSVVGIRRLAWPRTAVIRAAAWLLARNVLQSWVAKPGSQPSSSAAAAVEACAADRPFDLAAVRPWLERLFIESLRRPTAEVVDQVLRPLIEASDSERSDGSLARSILKRLQDLLGGLGRDENEQPCEFGRLLAARVREIAAEIDARLGTSVLRLVEQPGLRLAGAEDALHLLRDRLANHLAAADREAMAIEDRARAQLVLLHQSHFIASSQSVATSSRTAADRASQIGDWARTRIEALLARACANVYRALIGNQPEYTREVTAVRNQVSALISQLDSEPPVVPDPGGVLQPVYPGGESSVSEAAARIVMTLGPEDLRELDNAIQARTRHEFRGLAAVCNRPREAGPAFLAAVVDQASRFLEVRTPHLTASQALALQTADPEALRTLLSGLAATARPQSLGPERNVSPMLAVLGAPEADAAGHLVNLVRDQLPTCAFRFAAVEDEIVLYQEAVVSVAALPHLAGDPPDSHANGQGLTAPHARTDVRWTPVGLSGATS